MGAEGDGSEWAQLLHLPVFHIAFYIGSILRKKYLCQKTPESLVLFQDLAGGSWGPPSQLHKLQIGRLYLRFWQEFHVFNGNEGGVHVFIRHLTWGSVWVEVEHFHSPQNP